MDINKLVKSDKFVLIIGVFSIFLIGILGSWWILSPKWVPVLANSEQSEASAEIENYLMEWQQEYRLNDEGLVLVPEESVIVLRKKLSDIGIPSQKEPGFEIFNDAEYGMSEFTQRINYQRAIEAELARTIRTYSNIKDARVHLSIPKESIFRDKKSIPKASVSIQAMSGKTIDKNSIYGIKNLVSASVDGLKPENVIVIDKSGNQYFVEKDNGKEIDHQSKSEIENYYANKVKKLVEGAVPENLINVVVEAEYNHDKVKSVKEQILPSDDGITGFVRRHSKVSSEDSKSKKEKALPSIRLEEEFIYSSEKSEIEYAVGKLERLSVGIVIVGEFDSEFLKMIEQVVAAGLGLEIENRDYLSVVALPVYLEEDVIFDAKMGHVDRANNPDKIFAKKDIDTKFEFVKAHFTELLVLGGLVSIIFVLLVIYVLKGKKEDTISPEERRQVLEELKAWLSKDQSEGVK